jgi:hypothetical protein
MANNFTTTTIQQQLMTQSGQIAVQQYGGSYRYVDQSTGKPLNLPSVSSSFLSNTFQKINNPRLSAQALNKAKGLYNNSNAPTELIEAIATVAAYINATRGISIDQLITSSGVTLQFIQIYNSLKSKGSQLGISNTGKPPAWVNNPTLMGSIAAAYTVEQ